MQIEKNYFTNTFGTWRYFDVETELFSELIYFYGSIDVLDLKTGKQF